jgi:hypothetical protein
MIIYHVTFADTNMTRSQDLCMGSALSMGVDDSRGYNPDWWTAWKHVDTFEWLNKETLNQARGAGYWLWKPWAIADRMKMLNDGDILIYSDAGVEFIAPVQEIINRMEEDIFFFTNGWPHIEWCKMDCIESIIPDKIKIDGTERDIKQVQASVIFFRVNAKTRAFVKEWLLYSQMPGFIDDSPSKVPNYPTFAEHRHDQSILTCLQIKYGYKMHWWPTTYSMHLERSAEDSYPVMFNHHRRRNNEW